MRPHLVYDLPLRIFHWSFAALFGIAFFIAKTVDDESPVFTYHMLAGMTLSFVVVLRIIWGFFGTRYSRFASFPLAPRQLVNYFKEIFGEAATKWSGHNPASSWATLLMLALALGLGITGYLMSNGRKESLEDLHELLANGFLVVVLAHVAGVVFHSLRHRDGIALSVFDGHKNNVESDQSIRSTRPWAGLVFVFSTALFVSYLLKNFDSQKGTLVFLGTTMQLGENEEENGSERKEDGSEDGENKNVHDDNDND